MVTKFPDIVSHTVKVTAQMMFDKNLLLSYATCFKPSYSFTEDKMVQNF